MPVGSHTNDFGTPGCAEHAMSLDTPEDAARFNRRLVNACLRAHTQTERCGPNSFTWRSSAPAPRGRSWRPSCTSTTRTVVAYGLDRIDPAKDLSITLIEAAPRILPALPERLSKAADGTAAGPRRATC